MSPGPRITLIHAVQVAIAPVADALRALWPEARAEHLWDDGLGPALAAAGALTPQLKARIRRLAEHALANGADGVLYTCSAFGEAIAEVAAAHPQPILRPNEAMFEAALQAGPRVGLVATFASACAPMEAEFHALCAARGRGDITLRTLCLPEALADAQAGRLDAHDARHLQAVPDFAAGCDVLMLAHFSNARVQPLLQARLDRPVLAAPQAAVQALRARLQSAA